MTSGERLLSEKPALTLGLGLGEAPPGFASSIRAEQSPAQVWALHWSRHRRQRGHGSELSLPAELGQAASWIRVLCQAELI